jgi:hypothetical protein
MEDSWYTPRGAHLVGSIPLEDNEAVFRFVGNYMAGYVRRIPDGETGERKNWIDFQSARLHDSPQLREIDYAEYGESYELPKFEVLEGYDAGQIQLPDLGYADAAIDSWQVFEEMRDQGILPAYTRFQVSLPTPLATTAAYLMPDHQPTFETAYRHKLLSELEEILRVVPHDDLAIQWDTAVEFALIEGVWPSHLDDVEADIDERLIGLADHVPESVELGYHLCYGDREHQHFEQPDDAGHLVRVASTIADEIDRTLQWVHMPVPRDRTDTDYIQPIENLDIPDTTELYLGLVHYSDGVEGTRRRIQAASEFLDEFGVATECGWGRRDPETIEALASIHTEVADPIAGRPDESRPTGGRPRT